MGAVMEWVLGIGVLVAVWFGYTFVQGWKDGNSGSKATTKPPKTKARCHRAEGATS